MLSWLSFLNPWLLAGGVLVGVPILIHLLNRRRFRVVAWAAMDFLLQAERENRRRIRLENILLLLLRCLAVALLVLLVARPLLQPNSLARAMLPTAPVERLILLDDSPSMGVLTRNQSGFAVAVAGLADFIRRSAREQPNDTVTLLTTSHPEHPLARGQSLAGAGGATLARRVAQLQPSDRSADYAAALPALEELLADKGGPRHRVVYIISDLLQRDWPAPDNRHPERGRAGLLQRLAAKADGLYLIAAGATPAPNNLAITNLAPLDKTLVAGLETRFAVTVTNFGSVAAEDVEVSFHSGESLELHGRIPHISAGGQAVLPFSYTFPQTGMYPVEAQLGPDALPADNCRRYAARVQPGVEVLLVDEAAAESEYDPAGLLAHALAPPGEIRSGNLVRRIGASRFAGLDLGRTQAIFLGNLYHLSDERLAALEQWVNAGGGLVVILGEQVDAGFYNERLYRGGAGLLPVRLNKIVGDEQRRQWAGLAVDAAAHPVLRIFAGEQNPFTKSVKFFRWWDSVAAARADVQVLASYTGAEPAPALVEKTFGKGRVLALTSAPGGTWNNWPADPSFVVTMLELVRYVARADDTPSTFTVGTPIHYAPDLAQVELEARLVPPAQEAVALAAAPGPDGRRMWLTYPATDQAGFYTLELQRRDGGRENRLYAANSAADEGDLRPADLDNLRRQVGDAKLKILPGVAQLSAAAAVGGGEIWRPILFTLAAVLALELFLAWAWGRRWATGIAGVAFVLGLLVASAPPAQAQGFAGAAAPPPPTTPSATQPATHPGAGDDDYALTSATLETDADLDSLLRRAREFIADQHWREAALVLQHVIDHAGGNLTTQDGRVFVPAAAEAEKLLAGLPAEGLDLYRLSVDGQAQALLSGPDAYLDEAALHEVVRRFFLSSLGERAAYQLGCLLLNRQDFSGARRVWRKLLAEYPRPTIDRAQVLIRLAVAQARLGEAVAAAAALAQAEQLNSGALTPRLDTLVRREVARAAAPPATAPEPALWSMPLGGPRHDRRMPNLPAAGQPGGLWTVLWQFQHSLAVPPTAGLERYGNLYAGNRIIQTRRQIVSRWEKNAWLPTGQILLDHRRAYLRGHNTLICLDLETGQVIWQVQDQPARVGPHAMVFFQSGLVDPRQKPAPPSSPEEVFFFGDRVGKEMSLVDDVVYQIESQVPPVYTGPRMMFALLRQQSGALPPNTLAAYAARTGQLRWRLAGDNTNPASTTAAPGADKKNGVSVQVDVPVGATVMVQVVAENSGSIPAAADPLRFLTAPLPCAGRLLVAAENNEGLWLVAIDPSAGRIVWRRFLCGGAAAPRAAWSPPGLAAAGQDVFVATGRGLVFALDGTDGGVLWVNRYSRTPPAEGKNPVNNPMGRMMSMGPPLGWSEDTLVLADDRLLVMPSDGDQLLALSRFTGQTQYAVPRQQANYCVGLTDAGLLVAGPDTLRCHAVATGELVWQTPLQAALGRAMLTDRTVYVPQESSVACFDPRTGRRGAAISVATPQGDPVGNLFSDGRHLLVTGLECVYALTDSDYQLAALAPRIAQGAAAARLARARLYRRLGRLDDALGDYRALLVPPGQPEDASARQARQELLDLFLAQAAGAPAEQTAAALAQARPLARDEAEQLRVDLALAADESRRGLEEQALAHYLTVAADSSGVMVALEPDETGMECRALAANIAAVAVAKIQARLGQGVMPRLELQSQAALDQATTAGADVDRLLAVARAYPDTAAAFTAACQAARRARDAGQFERGELILRDLTRSRRPACAAAGLAALAHFYQDQKWFVQAAEEWRQLARRYPDAKIVSAGQTLPAAAVATAALTDLTQQAGAIPAPHDALTHLPNRLLWTEPNPVLHLLRWDDADATQFDREHVVYLQGNKPQLFCRELRTGRIVWKVQLPSNAKGDDDELPPPQRFNMVLQATGGRIIRDGHVGLIPLSGRMLGVSLISGQQLWTLATDKYNAGGGGIDLRLNAGRFGPLGGHYVGDMVMGEGLVAQRLLDPERLVEEVRVCDAATATPLWTRTFDRQVADALWIGAGCVNVVTDEFHKIWACDRRTGAIVSQVALDDHVEGSPFLPCADNVIYCTPAAVVCRDWPHGAQRWSLPLRGIERLALLAPEVCGLVSRGGTQLQLVDIANGKETFQFNCNALKCRFLDMALTTDGARLVLVGFTDKGGQITATLDLASGQTLGVMNLAPPRPAIQLISAATQTRTGPWLLAAQMDRPGSVSNQPSLVGPFARIEFYNRADGRLLENFALPTPRGGGKLRGISQPPQVQDDVLLVQTQDGLMAFGYEEEK